MEQSIMNDRAAQLLLLAEPDLGYDAARTRLERTSIKISINESANCAWGQAAITTLARCAVRMFRGGVHLDCPTQPVMLIGEQQGIPLFRVLVELGCRLESAPEHASSIHIGSDSQGSPLLYCWADGWCGHTSPNTPSQITNEGNVLGGAIAGAMAASEIFRLRILSDMRAGKREQSISALYPKKTSTAEEENIPLTYLPSNLWLLGLGNLGQAALWILSLLPYHDPNEVTLLLQDMDTTGPENLGIQILTTHQWVGKKKAREAAKFAEKRGFRTVISEQRFTDTSVRSIHEPGVLLCGVDNLDARRAAARIGSGFDLVIDAGLGGSATEVFDIRIHSFPGDRSPDEAWPVVSSDNQRQLPSSLQSLINEGRLDNCGAITIAGKSMGIPTTAVVAAAIQIGQVCRTLASGEYCDLIDLTLRNTATVTSQTPKELKKISIPFSS